MATVVGTCRIAPPPVAAAEQTLPLSFFDILWVHFHPIRRLLFYEFPCSHPYFFDTLLPKLKESLSLTLKHFSPLAGYIVYPLNPEKKPVIRYRAGDSVSLTVSESSDDFGNLVGNHARDADKFYDFIPLLRHLTDESDQKLLEVLAIQVTLFPGRGVCIGVANHHGVGDASSVVGFIRSWASINKHGGGEEGILSEPLPVFDRSLINYPREFDSIFWNQIKESPMASPAFPLPTNRVRATYVFTQLKLKKLKDIVQTRIPGLVHVSSFVVTAAYIWTCLAKSLISGEKERVQIDDDDLDFFLFAVDLRTRIDPPVPGNYLGNCISYGLPKIKHEELVGEEGFILASKAIAEEIQNRVINNVKILEGVKNWMPEIWSAFQNRVLSVSGSARVDVYGVDFGWGKARKMEALSIDGERYAMSLCRSRDCEGGLEIGLSLPKEKMEAFDAIFHGGIKNW